MAVKAVKATIPGGFGAIPKAVASLYSAGQNIYNSGKKISSAATNRPSTSPAMEAYLKALRASTASIQAQIAANQRATAPDLDLNALYAKSRKEAAKAQNPYYNKELNLFLKEQAFKKNTQKAQAATDTQTYEDQLKQTLESNDITGQRTTEDVARNTGQINTQEDQFQTDAGEEFDVERFAQARVQAQAGQTGGLGAQAQETAQLKRNTGEKRATQEFDTKREDQQIFKARTFQDLARSGEQAKTSKEKGVKQVKFDLDTFIKQQGFEKTSKKRQLQAEKKQAVTSDASRRAAIKVNKFIQSVSDPVKRQAAREAYGGIYG